MSPRRLAADERGFTLVELLAAILVGTVVLLAAFSLLDLATKSRARTSARVEAAGSGRAVMDHLTRALRSQLCPGGGRPALVDAQDASVTIIGSVTTAPTTSGQLSYQQRRFTFTPEPADPTRFRLVEALWTTTTQPPNVSFGATPDSQRVVAEGLAAPLTGERFFTYRRYDPAAAPATLPLATPVGVAERQRVVQIDVAFDTYARSSRDSRLRTAFADQVFVRTATAADPLRSPACS